MNKRKANGKQKPGEQKMTQQQTSWREKEKQPEASWQSAEGQQTETRKGGGQDRKKELERLILAYTEELAEEINLRLLSQQEIDPAGFHHGCYHTGEVLYVESIVVTNIRYPKQQKKRGSSLTQLGNNVKKILKRR